MQYQNNRLYSFRVLSSSYSCWWVNMFQDLFLHTAWYFSGVFLCCFGIKLSEAKKSLSGRFLVASLIFLNHVLKLSLASCFNLIYQQNYKNHVLEIP